MESSKYLSLVAGQTAPLRKDDGVSACTTTAMSARFILGPKLNACSALPASVARTSPGGWQAAVNSATLAPWNSILDNERQGWGTRQQNLLLHGQRHRNVVHCIALERVHVDGVGLPGWRGDRGCVQRFCGRPEFGPGPEYSAAAHGACWPHNTTRIAGSTGTVTKSDVWARNDMEKMPSRAKRTSVQTMVALEKTRPVDTPFVAMDNLGLMKAC